MFITEEKGLETMYVVETRGLAKAYGGKRVVDDFSMHVSKGDVYGFVGKNGAGKSTVLKMLAGLVAPTTGEISLFGSKLESESALSRVGTLIEDPGLLPNLSAFDNLMAKALALGIPDSKPRCRQIVQTVGLEDAGTKRAKRYSLGMKQRLGLGLALLGSPDLLLLDEPFNGLDPEGTRDMRMLVARLNQSFGVTVVISSHVLDQLDRIVTRYGIIAGGRMVREMSAQQVQEECGDSLRIRVAQPQLALARLEQAFPDLSILVEPDQALRVRGDYDVRAVADALHASDSTVLELSETRRDIEDYFVSLMEGGARRA